MNQTSEFVCMEKRIHKEFALVGSVLDKNLVSDYFSNIPILANICPCYRVCVLDKNSNILILANLPNLFFLLARNDLRFKKIFTIGYYMKTRTLHWKGSQPTDYFGETVHEAKSATQTVKNSNIQTLKKLN